MHLKHKSGYYKILGIIRAILVDGQLERLYMLRLNLKIKIILKRAAIPLPDICAFIVFCMIPVGGSEVIPLSASNDRKDKLFISLCSKKIDSSSFLIASLMERPSKRIKVEDDVEDQPIQAEQEVDLPTNDDLYLETVDRFQLDFDQEQICSVTLSNLNVYACLVCGKYFAGRSRTTPAFFHSLESDHHVFLNLSSLKAYILPDSYENKSATLADIKYNACPTYTREQCQQLDKDTSVHHDLSRTTYRSGFVGMNNSKSSDIVPVVVHAIAHISPIRDFFLVEDLRSKSEIVRSFSLLVRKLWSAKLLKAHVNPHEFVLQSFMVQKEKKLMPRYTDPQDYLTHLINTFHLALGGHRTDQSRTSIISSTLRGTLQIETQKIREVMTSSAHASDPNRLRFEADVKIETTTCPFTTLSLDLPPAPLFQDQNQKTVIPQVSLLELLAKYNGSQVLELPGLRRRYSIVDCPQYLIMTIRRFKKTDFSRERNSTIVTFPLKSLDMSPYLVSSAGRNQLYDLLVNVTHESVYNPSSGSGDEKHHYKVQVRDKALDTWVQMDGLFVENVKKEVISIGESVLQVWERRQS